MRRLARAAVAWHALATVFFGGAEVRKKTDAADLVRRLEEFTIEGFTFLDVRSC